MNDEPHDEPPRKHESGGAETQDPVAATSDGRVMDHEYDGIREYDNPLPGWWVTTFWLTFLFSLGYFFHYHLSGRGMSIHDAYAEEVKRHEALVAHRAAEEEVTEQVLETLMGTSAARVAGQKIFAARCEACHAAQGQGLVGPNLTDSSWIHGRGALIDIYQVVHDGVSAKGMPAWSRQLTPIELRQVVVFVGTLRGKNVSGKAPEGNAVALSLPGSGGGAITVDPKDAQDQTTAQPNASAAMDAPQESGAGPARKARAEQPPVPGPGAHVPAPGTKAVAAPPQRPTPKAVAGGPAAGKTRTAPAKDANLPASPAEPEEALSLPADSAADPP